MPFDDQGNWYPPGGVWAKDKVKKEDGPVIPMNAGTSGSKDMAARRFPVEENITPIATATPEPDHAGFMSSVLDKFKSAAGAITGTIGAAAKNTWGSLSSSVDSLEGLPDLKQVDAFATKQLDKVKDNIPDFAKNIVNNMDVTKGFMQPRPQDPFPQPTASQVNGLKQGPLDPAQFGILHPDVKAALSFTDKYPDPQPRTVAEDFGAGVRSWDQSQYKMIGNVMKMFGGGESEKGDFISGLAGNPEDFVQEHRFEGYKSMLDPHYVAGSLIAQGVPSMLSLMPLSFAGAELGAGAAAAMGFGKVATIVTRTLAGVLASRPGESLMEASQTYESMPGSHDTKMGAAGETFWKNMAVGTPLDALELGAVFLPKGIGGIFSKLKIDTIPGKMLTSGILEGGEEGVQNWIQNSAQGLPTSMSDPAMKEAIATGAALGMGMAGSMSMLEHVREAQNAALSVNNRALSKMNDETRADFIDSLKDAKELGMSDEEAIAKMMDEWAGTPEGEQAFVDATNEVVESVGTAQAVKTPGQQDAEVQPGEQPAAAPEAAAPTTNEDVTYQKAVDRVRSTGNATTSDLQLHLKIGYTAIAKIFDRMENEGIVTPYDQEKGRQVVGHQESAATPEAAAPAVDPMEQFTQDFAAQGDAITADLDAKIAESDATHKAKMDAIAERHAASEKLSKEQDAAKAASEALTVGDTVMHRSFKDQQFEITAVKGDSVTLRSEKGGVMKDVHKSALRPAAPTVTPAATEDLSKLSDIELSGALMQGFFKQDNAPLSAEEQKNFTALQAEKDRRSVAKVGEERAKGPFTPEQWSAFDQMKQENEIKKNKFEPVNLIHNPQTGEQVIMGFDHKGNSVDKPITDLARYGQTKPITTGAHKDVPGARIDVVQPVKGTGQKVDYKTERTKPSKTHPNGRERIVVTRGKRKFFFDVGENVVTPDQAANFRNMGGVDGVTGLFAKDRPADDPADIMPEMTGSNHLMNKDEFVKYLNGDDYTPNTDKRKYRDLPADFTPTHGFPDGRKASVTFSKDGSVANWIADNGEFGSNAAAEFYGAPLQKQLQAPGKTSDIEAVRTHLEQFKRNDYVTYEQNGEQKRGRILNGGSTLHNVQILQMDENMKPVKGNPNMKLELDDPTVMTLRKSDKETLSGKLGPVIDAEQIKPIDMDMGTGDKDQNRDEAPTTGKVKDNLDWLKNAEQAAKDRIASRKGRLMSGLPMDDLVDYAIIGASKIAHKGLEFAAWSEEMLSEYGPSIKLFLRGIYGQSQAMLDMTPDEVNEMISLASNEDAPVTEKPAAVLPTSWDNQANREAIIKHYFEGHPELVEQLQSMDVFHDAAKGKYDYSQAADAIQEAIKGENIRDTYLEVTPKKNEVFVRTVDDAHETKFTYDRFAHYFRDHLFNKTKAAEAAPEEAITEEKGTKPGVLKRGMYVQSGRGIKFVSMINNKGYPGENVILQDADPAKRPTDPADKDLGMVAFPEDLTIVPDPNVAAPAAEEKPFGNLHFVVYDNKAEMEAVRRSKPKSLLMSFNRWKKKGKIAEFVKSLGYKPKVIVDNGAYSGIDVGMWEVMDFFQREYDNGDPSSVLLDLKRADYEGGFDGESFEIRKEFPEFFKYMDWIDTNSSAIDYVIPPDLLTGDLSEREEKIMYAFQFFQSARVGLIPVFPFGSERSFLDSLIKEGADYIGLGGTAKGVNENERAAWAASVVKDYPEIKFHMLGTNNQRLIDKIPGLYSADGSTWRSASMHGKQGEDRITAGAADIAKREEKATGSTANNPFPKSKVPETVYHGSGANNIEEFFTTKEDLGSNTGAATARLGAFFSENEDIAAMASFGFSAMGAFDSKRSMTLYETKINIENPLNLNNLSAEEISKLDQRFPGFAKAHQTAEDPFNALQFLARFKDRKALPPNFATYGKEHGLSEDEITSSWQNTKSPEFNAWQKLMDDARGEINVTKALEELGYDGVIVKTTMDSGEKIGPQKQYVVFRPQDIKIMKKSPVAGESDPVDSKEQTEEETPREKFDRMVGNFDMRRNWPTGAKAGLAKQIVDMAAEHNFTINKLVQMKLDKIIADHTKALADKVNEPDQTKGKEATVTTERGTKIQVRYALIDVNDVLTSHDDDFQPNDNYPQDLQPRDRERAGSQDQVRRIAAKLNPDLLGVSPKSSDGAPIMAPDSTIESGNGRVMALRAAYKSGKIGEYQKWLLDNAESFGLTKAWVQDWLDGGNPILIRIRETKMTHEERVRFAHESNETNVARMSATEKAKADAAKLTGEMLDLFAPGDDGNILAAANRDFVRSFVAGVVGPNERTEIMDKNGALNQEGINRIKNAIFAKAYGDTAAIERLVESTDNNVKTITNAMLSTAPRMAAVRAAMERGELYQELDPTPDILSALQTLSSLRNEGQTVEFYLSQGDIFGSNLSDEAKNLLVMFEHNRRSAKKIATYLNEYLDVTESAGSPNQLSMFDDDVTPTRIEVQQAALQTLEVKEDANQATLWPDASGSREQVDQESAEEAPRAAETPAPPTSYQDDPTTGKRLVSLKSLTDRELSDAYDDSINERDTFAHRFLAFAKAAEISPYMENFNGEVIEMEAYYNWTDLWRVMNKEIGARLKAGTWNPVKPEIPDHLKSLPDTELKQRYDEIKTVPKRNSEGEFIQREYHRRMEAEREAWNATEKAKREAKQAQLPQGPATEMKKTTVGKGVTLTFNGRISPESERKLKQAGIEKLFAEDWTVYEGKKDYGIDEVIKKVQDELNSNKRKAEGAAKKAEAAAKKVAKETPAPAVQDDQADTTFTKENILNMTRDEFIDQSLAAYNKKFGTKKTRGDRSNSYNGTFEAMYGNAHDVIVKSAKKEEAPVPPADTNVIDQFRSGAAKLKKLDYNLADVQAQYDLLVNHEAELKAHFMDLINNNDNHKRKRANTKAEMVENIYNNELKRIALSDSDSYMVELSYGGDREDEKVTTKKKLDKITDESIAAYIAEKRARVEADHKAMTNPETLAELQQKKAYGALTEAEQALYDEKLAESLKERKEDAAVRKAEAKGTVEAIRGGSVSFDIRESTHTKTGEKLWVAALTEKFPDDLYKEIRDKIKKLGGYYSSYKPNVGFIFKEDPTEKLAALTGGETIKLDTAAEVAEQKQDKQQSTAEKLRSMADKMQETIDDYRRDRPTHTHRMARQAASSASSADGLERLQGIMRNIANAMDAGEAKHLDGITARTHIETLDRLLVQRTYDMMIENKEQTLDRNGNHIRRAPKLEDIAGMEFPKANLDMDRLKKFVDMLIKNKVKGTMRTAAKIDKLIHSTKRNNDKAYLVDVTPYLDEIQEMFKDAENNTNKTSTIADEARNFKERLMTVNRLHTMGIERPEQLRAALREYLTYREGTGVTAEELKRREQKAKESEVTRMNIPGFFPTPDPIVEQMLDEANIGDGMRVLEPSAGKGNIAEAIREAHPDADLQVIEWNGTLRHILIDKGFNVIENEADFLKHETSEKFRYDRIIMNPPFENGQDIEHVQHAYEQLAPGGRIVAIMSEGPFFRSDKKATAFREWLEDLGGVSEPLPEGAFKSSERPTGVNTRIVTIDKPAGGAAVNPVVRKEYDRNREDIRWILNQPQEVKAIQVPSDSGYLQVVKDAYDQFEHGVNNGIKPGEIDKAVAEEKQWIASIQATLEIASEGKPAFDASTLSAEKVNDEIVKLLNERNALIKQRTDAGNNNSQRQLYNDLSDAIEGVTDDIAALRELLVERGEAKYPEVLPLYKEYRDVLKKIDTLEGRSRNPHLDAVAKMFHLGTVGGAQHGNREMAKLNKRRGQQMEKDIELAKKLRPLYDQRSRLEVKINSIERGKTAAENNAKAKIREEVQNAGVGDIVQDSSFGPMKVIRVNKNTLTLQSLDTDFKEARPFDLILRVLKKADRYTVVENDDHTFKIVDGQQPNAILGVGGRNYTTQAEAEQAIEALKNKPASETITEQLRADQKDQPLGIVPASQRNKRPGNIPQTNAYQSSDPTVEKQIKRAVYRPPGTWDKFKEWSEKLWRQATREFQFLPNTAMYSKVRFELHRMQKAPAIAQDEVIRGYLTGITRNLSSEDYELMMRTALLRDLKRDFDRDVSLKFGYTEDVLNVDLDNLEAAVAQNPKVIDALDLRNRFFKEMTDQLIAAYDKIDIDVSSKFQLENYLRHLVLEYVNGDRQISASKKSVKARTNSGYMKRRDEGGRDDTRINEIKVELDDVNEILNDPDALEHELAAAYAQEQELLKELASLQNDFVVDVLTADTEVLTKMITDIQTAEVLRVIMHDPKLNKKPGLVQKAKDHNAYELDKLFADEIASEQYVRAQLTIGGDEFFSPSEQEYKEFAKSIAIGMSKLSQLATKDLLWIGDNGEYKAMVDSLKKGATKATDGKDKFFDYLKALMASNTDGSMGAGMIIKAVGQRQSWVRNHINYKEWQDFVEDGFTKFEPQMSSKFYPVQEIDVNKLARDLAANILTDVASVDDLEPYLTTAFKKAEQANVMVIPDDLAATLLDLSGTHERSSAFRAIKYVNNFMKRNLLFAAPRFVQYELRNFSSDFEKIIQNNPAALKYLKTAAAQLYGFVMKDHVAPNEDVANFARMGGLQTLYGVAELGDMHKLEQFTRFYEKADENKVWAVMRDKVWDGYWKGTRRVDTLRETTGRFAMYLAYLDQLNKNGGRPKNYGSSIRAEVDSLETNEKKAFLLANDALIDYSKTSHLGQRSRDTVAPFWSFQEGNTRSNFRWIRNVIQDDRLASGVAQKLMGKAIAKTPYYAFKIGKAYLMWSMLTILLAAWNHGLHDDEEDELPPEVRNQLHIIWGRDWKGNIMYTTGLGAAEDFLKWAGVDDTYSHMMDLFSGKKTFQEVATDIAKQPVNKIIGLLNPIGKNFLEGLTGLSTFPDIFTPSQNGDSFDEKMMGLLGVTNEYKLLKKKLGGVPARNYNPLSLVTTLKDPGESAYYEVKDMVRQYQKRNGLPVFNGGASGSGRSEALYQYKQALKFGDEEAADRYLNAYAVAGGTLDGLRSSLESLNPTSALNRTDMALFLNGLNEKDMKIYDRAMDFYTQTLLGSDPLK